MNDFELKTCPEIRYPDDFDEEKINAFIRKTKLDLDLLPEEWLAEFGVAKLNHVGRLVYNNLAAVFFAKRPRKFVFHSYVTCVRYKGIGKSEILDRKDFENGLLDQIEGAEAFVKRNTRTSYVIEGFQRYDRQEYPIEAIREAIINAVSHRDYEIDNTGIFVNIYDDRIEVISPGGLPDDLTLKDVEDKSHPRNPVLVQLLHKAKIVEQVGSGFKRMKEQMILHGSSEPEFKASRMYFEVIFKGPKGDLSRVGSAKVIDLRKLGLNERQINALNHFQKQNEFNFKEYWQFIGGKEWGDTFNKMAVRDLGFLVKKGLIGKKGSRKESVYYLSK